jgi:hypothetical protein
MHLSRGVLLPAWGVARWLRWPISLDLRFDQYTGCAFQTYWNEMYFGQLFQREAEAGKRPCIFDDFAARMPTQRVSGSTFRGLVIRGAGEVIMAQTMVHPHDHFMNSSFCCRLSCTSIFVLFPSYC